MPDKENEQKPPCKNPCSSKQTRCIRDTEYCHGLETYCIRHCPCKQKLGGTKRKYETNKENCDNCNPTLARCELCERCSYCCKKNGACTIVKTPAPKRSKREAVMEGIHVAQAKTPLVTKLQSGELELASESKEAQLFDVLGIDKSAFHNFPLESIRQLGDALEKIEQTKNADRACEELVHVMGCIYEETAKLLMPNSSEWLLESHFLKLSKARGKDMKKRGKILEGIAKEVIDLANTMPRNTMGYRIARAIIVCNASNRDLLQTFADLGPPPKFGRAARTRGKDDMKRAKDEKKDPEKKRRTFARLSDDNIERMVKHILSFVQTLSWGTKTLRQNGKNETTLFPRLTRTAPVQVMFEDFAKMQAQLKCVELDANIQPPQRTLYFQIAAQITSKAEKSISCIDYVMDILINVPVTVMTTIIEQVVAPTQQARMKELLKAVQHFLKYQYDSHLSSDSTICSHDIKHALGLESESDEGDSSASLSSTRSCEEIDHEDSSTSSSSTRSCEEIVEDERCPGCEFVEYFMQVELPNAVESNRSRANTASVDDALLFIQDSLDKFRRYKAHRVRVVNQQEAIEKVNVELQEQVLKTGKRGTIVKITIDYKQKYLEKRLRSSQMNDFGQRGITWHIVVVEYYDYEAPCESNNFQAKPVRVQIPLDQILNSGNKQDGPCVLSMLEAMLKMIKAEMPWVEEVVLISDNANCYHSKEVIFSICLLNQLAIKNGGPLIVKYIHPETQDGKGPCDSHAAVAGTHVDRHFICTRKDGTLTYNEACTPTEVANALCSNGGIKNSAVQLIKLDFPRLAKISKVCSGADEKALEYFARANEIRFFPDIDRLAKWSELDLMDETNWAAMEPLIQVINYSNISEGTVFKVGFADWQEGKGSFTPVVSPDHHPEWKVDVKAQLVSQRLFHLVKQNIAADQKAKSLFAQARAHIKAANIGKDLFQHAVAAVLGGSGINNDDVSDIFCTSTDDGLQANAPAGEADDDAMDEEECFETLFEIERALETRLEHEENAFQYEYDESWESDIEDDDDDDDDDETNGNEEDTGQERNSLTTNGDDGVGVSEKVTALVDAPKKDYDKKCFFTGVEVTHHKPFGTLIPTGPKKKEDGEEKKKKKLVEEWDSRAAVDKAIGFAIKHVGGQACSIRSAREEDFEAYKIADGWTQPLILSKGWARRPLSGGLYGKNYMNEEFKEICVEQFNRGVSNKGDKQSPSQTLEVMKERYPGLYCYPGIHEIVRTFSSLVQQYKKDGKQVKLSTKSQPLVPPEIKAELQSLLEANPLLTGKPLFELWKQQFASDYEDYDAKKVVQQANYLRQKMLADARKRLKRSMAG